MREHCDEGATFDGISNLLRRVQYARMADTNNWPIWLSDFTVDRPVTIPKDVTNRYDRYRSNNPVLMAFLTNKMRKTQWVFAHKEEYRKGGGAWTNGTDTLVIEGTGAVASMPWAENPAGTAGATVSIFDIIRTL